MLSLTQSITLGALQGIAELFPISSLGHSVLLPGMLGWNINEQDPTFLIFLVATHLATALVLLLFYWSEWLLILAGILRSLREREIRADDHHAKLGWLLVVSTIPAGVLGLLFEEHIRLIFISPLFAAGFLVCNGVLLFFAEWLRRKSALATIATSSERIAHLSWGQGLFVGALQSLALMPGFSRTGASLAGGLWVGLSHEDALHLAFLLATPIIAAAAVLKLPELWSTGSANMINTFVGACFAAGFAYIAVKFLTRYFALEKHTLLPFGVYCIVLGAGALFYLH